MLKYELLQEKYVVTQYMAFRLQDFKEELENHAMYVLLPIRTDKTIQMNVEKEVIFTCREEVVSTYVPVTDGEWKLLTIDMVSNNFNLKSVDFACINSKYNLDIRAIRSNVESKSVGKKVRDSGSNGTRIELGTPIKCYISPNGIYLESYMKKYMPYYKERIHTLYRSWNALLLNDAGMNFSGCINNIYLNTILVESLSNEAIMETGDWEEGFKCSSGYYSELHYIMLRLPVYRILRSGITVDFEHAMSYITDAMEKYVILDEMSQSINSSYIMIELSNGLKITYAKGDIKVKR